MRAATLTCVLLLVGCGGDDDAVLPDVLLPTIASFGGPVIAHLQLVPIFYADDADAEPLSRFSEWVVTSTWLTEVGAEYGVGPGAVLGVVHRTENAPDETNDTQIANLLFQGVADGTLPTPPGGLGDAIYIVNFPQHSHINYGTDRSCIAFGGYHQSARRGSAELAYAVIPTCPGYFQGLGTLEERQVATSHELIEAATDPIPFNRPAFQLRDPVGTWNGLGTEVADLCVRSDETGMWREGGFIAQRSWSNVAGATGDPCVPVSSPDPYFNVVPISAALVRVEPGEHETRTLVGWSSASTSDWQISVQANRTGNPMVTLSDDQLSAGQSTTLDISVPSTTPRNTILRLFVYSAVSPTQYQVLPMTAMVDVSCSSYRTCESCSAHIGCGFCITTGKCETEGVDGSAESVCPAASFSTWPGSCGNFCDTHGSSCAECSSQAGCGWCASDGGHCVEASHDQGHPQSAPCDYADWYFTPDYCPLQQ